MDLITDNTFLITYLSVEIVVGYVQTDVTVLESDGVAHLNVGISRPATHPIATYFYLLVNTSDKSAAETGLPKCLIFINAMHSLTLSATRQHAMKMLCIII